MSKISCLLNTTKNEKKGQLKRGGAMINKEKRVQTFIYWNASRFFKKLYVLCLEFSAWLGEEHQQWATPWRRILGKTALAIARFFDGFMCRCLKVCCDLNPLSDEERKKLKEGREVL